MWHSAVDPRRTVKWIILSLGTTTPTPAPITYNELWNVGGGRENSRFNCITLALADIKMHQHPLNPHQ